MNTLFFLLQQSYAPLVSKRGTGGGLFYINMKIKKSTMNGLLDIYFIFFI